MNRRTVAATVLVVLVLALGAAWYLLASPLTATAFSETTCGSESACVVRTDDGIAALPADDGSETTVGFVFYTGARVTPEAYAPVAERVADAGYPVWIPALTLNFAVLDTDAAASVIDGQPEIEDWIIAGHSLGGAMAARYAASDDAVDGLALLAAYPEEELDLSASRLAVVSVYGTEDGLASVNEVLDASPRLPSDTDFVAVDGGNHGQFGNYGDQRGDNRATISPDAQWDATADALITLAERVESGS